MRRVQSLLKTMLMLIPMTAVPVMALFGIPQFFPVSASPFRDPGNTDQSGRVLERRVGQSDALRVRNFSTEPTASLDLFQPYDAHSQTRRPDTGDVVANAAANEMARRRLAWTNPLGDRQNATSADRRNIAAVANSRAGLAFTGQAAVPPGRTARLSESTPDPAPSKPSETMDRYSIDATDTQSMSRNARHSQVESISWAQAVDRLNELGIRTFRLTPHSEPTGYRFACLVTSIDDPRISRRFEAESADPLVAVGRVLAQVENWNLHQ